MCGIAGRFNFNGDKVSSQEIIKMTDTIVHRGPDDTGWYTLNNVGLGMRRLSIIDICTGHQPVFNEDESIVIVYNGELYNYKELTSEMIKKGHHFRTQSDTEVLVHLYEENGPEFIKQLNGMFAFALWDSKKEKLLLARDRVGIKPLSYYSDPEKLIFGSEIKSILTVDGTNIEPNLSSIRTYFIKSKYLSTETFFTGISHLSPGHYLEIDKNGIKDTEYWDAAFCYDNGFSEEALMKNTLETIETAVKNQLISEVPLGTYLSGGIDSSAVSVAAARNKTGLDTFGASFPEFEHHDETMYQESVSNSVKTHHHKFEMKSGDLVSDLQRILWHIEQPLAGVTVGQFRMAEFSRKKVKVILTGHGGDELFGGYPNHLVGTTFDGRKQMSLIQFLKRLKLVARFPQMGWGKVIYNLILFSKRMMWARRFFFKSL